ncbi:hypothetical protein BH09SUM1_BH09SUM1_05480 [soil metagenome]
MDDQGRETRAAREGRIRRLTRLFRRIAFSIAIASIALLVTKVIFADRFFATKFVFYIPALLLGPVAIFCALLSRVGRRVRLLISAAILVFGVIAFHQEQPVILSPAKVRAADGAKSISVMSFNVQAYFWGSQRVANAIIAQHPDVVCFVEGTFAGKAPPQMVRALGTEYHWVVGKRLSIASRLPIKDALQISATSELHALRATIEAPAGEFDVIAVDVKNPTLRNDRSAFDQLYALFQSQPGSFAALGDFNAPNGSWQLARAVEGLQDDLLTAGEGGYQASWPSPAPLWQIDHAFSRGLRAESAETVHVLASDHFPIVVNYALPAAD